VLMVARVSLYAKWSISNLFFSINVGVMQIYVSGGDTLCRLARIQVYCVNSSYFSTTVLIYCHFLAYFRPSRWRRYVPPKRWAFSKKHSVTTQKTVLFIITAVTTSNPTLCCLYMCSTHASLTFQIPSPFLSLYNNNNGSIILLHVHTYLCNGLVNKFPRRQILRKQSVARLRNNSDNRRSVFNVVRVMPSARQQNCKHVYNNRRFLCVVSAQDV
jgi:hypothetical protein